MNYRKFFRIIFSIIAVLYINQKAEALCYGDADHPIHPSIEKEYKSSRFVVEGAVLVEQRVSSPDDPMGYEKMLYTIEIARIFKGNPKHKITIYSLNNSAGFPMYLGTNYIIFAQEDDDGLFIDNCGNSGETKKLSNTILKITTLSRHDK
ncbi:MAG: hypothetical protein FWF46_09550 [Oscillospiraceae bacterium]|nr:hypothetical protein [Oscillospiraceae bacterium]